MVLFLFYSETMSNRSKNCWIDWNSTTLRFKWLFQMNICPICEAFLSHHVKFGLVPITLYHVFNWLAKNPKNTHHRTDFETDQKPDFFFFFQLLIRKLVYTFNLFFFVPLNSKDKKLLLIGEDGSRSELSASIPSWWPQEEEQLRD